MADLSPHGSAPAVQLQRTDVGESASLADPLRSPAPVDATPNGAPDRTRFTIFATPKPQTVPHIAMIQGLCTVLRCYADVAAVSLELLWANAVTSWSKLLPTPDISLDGDEVGLPALAAAVPGARHVAGVEYIVTKKGDHAPMLGPLFYQLPSTARSPTAHPDLRSLAVNVPPCSTPACSTFPWPVECTQAFADALMTVVNATDNFLMSCVRSIMGLNCLWSMQPSPWMHLETGFSPAGVNNDTRDICQFTGRPGGKNNPLFTGEGASYNYRFITREDVKGDNTWFHYELFH
eukprot:gene253-2385_t